MAKAPDGTCCICGKFGKLSFEHVPPEAAFNDRPIVHGKFDDHKYNAPGDPIRGRLQQRGAGGYTLCERCNSFTGAYYGKSFIEWTYQAMELMMRSDGRGSLAYPFHILPLRVIKQVLAMFFSANGDGFHKAHSDLVRFILNPETKYIKDEIRIFAYLTDGRISRQTGIVAAGNFGNSSITLMSEISFSPVGYLMTINSEPPDNRLTEITHFARYGLEDFDTVFLNMKKLPVEYYLPGDYRSMDEIMSDYDENMKEYGDMGEESF